MAWVGKEGWGVLLSFVALRRPKGKCHKQGKGRTVLIADRRDGRTTDNLSDICNQFISCYIIGFPLYKCKRTSNYVVRFYFKRDSLF